jgi:hypothetical protein
VHSPERLARVGADLVAQFAAVALEALERGRRASDGCLAPQQVGEERLVPLPLRIRGLESRERIAVRPNPAGRAGRYDSGGSDVRGSHLAHGSQRPGITGRHRRQAIRQG